MKCLNTMTNYIHKKLVVLFQLPRGIEQMTNENTEGNFANTLLDAGYSSCEVCFGIKLKRKGIMKWLEDKKFIKPKT